MAAKRSWPVQGDGEVHLVVQSVILGVSSSTMQSQTESTFDNFRAAISMSLFL